MAVPVLIGMVSCGQSVRGSDEGSAEIIIFDTPVAPEEEANVYSVVKRLNGTPLKNIVAEIEKEAITQKLKSSRGNVAQAAKELEVCKAALYEKMKRYDISAKKLR